MVIAPTLFHPLQKREASKHVGNWCQMIESAYPLLCVHISYMLPCCRVTAVQLARRDAKEENKRHPAFTSCFARGGKVVTCIRGETHVDGTRRDARFHRLVQLCSTSSASPSESQIDWTTCPADRSGGLSGQCGERFVCHLTCNAPALRL